MTEEFYMNYRRYEKFPIDKLKHLPEISCYNHNYYVGVDKELIYVETDELSEISEFYLVTCSGYEFFGFAYPNDKYITLQEEELT